MRGRSGGLRLARAAGDIVIGDVVRHTEQDIALVPCFTDETQPCAIAPGCVLKRALSRASEAFFEALDGYTLADLVKPRAALRGMLAIDMPDAARGRGRQPARL